MSREIVNAICRTFPGAEVSDPWGGGHEAWKVGGKMFACIGAVNDSAGIGTGARPANLRTDWDNPGMRLATAMPARSAISCVLHSAFLWGILQPSLDPVPFGVGRDSLRLSQCIDFG